MAQVSGIVRVAGSETQLEGKKTAYQLNPYPPQAPLTTRAMKRVAKNLFAYLAGQHVRIAGTIIGKVIYNAHLVASQLPVEDVKIAPESKDPLAQDIEQYFHKDAREIASKLNDAGILTISAWYHRIRNNYNQELAAFANYLQVAKERISHFLTKFERDVKNEALICASPRFPVRHGVNVERLAKITGAPVMRKAATSPPKFPKQGFTRALPSKVDLTKHVTDVKQQGMRGTCVAHAAAACLEAEYIRLGKATSGLNLSEQYLYWACKQIDGAKQDAGTLLRYAADILLQGLPKKKLAAGICVEDDWKYEELPKKGNEPWGPIPQKAKNGIAGKKYQPHSYSRIKHNSIRALKETLAAGHCVGLSVLTYHFWTDDYGWREAVISIPVGIEPDGAHAVCLVGYRDNDATHGDGYFIFKNSWSRNWGFGRSDPGFGSLPYRYVLREAIEAYAIGE